jgi:glycerol-3-phosphate cytidylyltransferase-like family protein
MILNFDDLKAHLGRDAMVDGAFDPVHSGHVAYFEAAALLGVPAILRPTAMSRASTLRSCRKPSALS